MKQTTLCLTSLLGGMIIGSALAMLLTPQSGPELRSNIRERLEGELEKMRQKIDDVRCKCEPNE